MIWFRLLCVFAVLTAGLGAQSESRFSPERLERLKVALSEKITRHEYAGGNALILCEGKTVLAESFGDQDIEAGKPMQADTIFWIASMTKPITAVAVMMLYEEGKFLLDEPVAKYLPAFANMRVLASEDGGQTETVPADSAITIRQLLTHTSGLFNYKAYNAADLNAQPTLEAAVDTIASVPLTHQPGRAWRYGWSYEVLARLVEVWSGQSYDAFLAERIFQPLRMVDTGFFVPADKAGRLAKGYKLNEQGTVEPLTTQRSVPDHAPTNISGSGGLYGTIGDFGRFAQMLLNGGELDGQRLLSPHTVDYMLTSQVPLDVMPPDGPNGRKGFGMGLGGYVLLDPAQSENLGIKGEYNGAGLGGTYYWIDPKNKLAGLWFTQRYPQVQSELHRFKVLVYQALVTN